MVKAVIFDLDGTLYSYDEAHAVAFRAVTDYAQARLGLDAGALLSLHEAGDRALRASAGENCAAVHNRLIRYQLMTESLGLPLSHAARMTELYWKALLGAMKPFPGAAECIRRLREAGLTVGVGTNMTADWQFAKLEKLGLLDQLHFIVTSEEAGAEKPDGRLFALCVKKAGCLPGQCVFVGDSRRHDAEGALAAGLRAVWLCREEAAEAPAGAVKLRALPELPALLSSL